MVSLGRADTQVRPYATFPQRSVPGGGIDK